MSRVLRGLGAGVAFALALLVLEWAWLPKAVAVEEARARLVVEYVLLGLVLGAAVGVPVSVLQRRARGARAGSATLLAAIAAACAVSGLVYPFADAPMRAEHWVALASAWGLAALVPVLVRRGAPVFRRVVRPLWGPQEQPHWPSLGIGALAGVLALMWARFMPARAAVAPAEGLPNVVLIVLDTLRRDHLSAYGYSRRTSPHFDRLAAEGTLYERAFTPTPSTLPAHASLFTGLYPSQHGADYLHTHLDSRHETLAERLVSQGYRTGGFVANALLTGTGIDEGFQDYEYTGRTVENLPFFVNRFKTRPDDLGGRELTQRLVAWIEHAHDSGRPFFAFANYLEVHAPYGTVPEPFRSAYLDSPIARGVTEEWLRDDARFLCSGCTEGERRDGMQCQSGRWHVGSKRLKDTTALYDAGVSYVDHLIGEVRGELERLGILDETVFIVTSDHGEMLGEGGHVGHGVYLYDSLLAVPLAIRYPKLFPAGARVSSSVSLLDVPSTVAEVAHVEVTWNGQQRSLVPSAGMPERPVWAEESPFHPHVAESLRQSLACDLRVAKARRLALQRGGLKYVWSSNGRHELFDTGRDPTEQQNLVHERTQLAADLQLDLLQWYASTRRGAREHSPSALDDSVRRALESLGYLQSSP